MSPVVLFVAGDDSPLYLIYLCGHAQRARHPNSQGILHHRKTHLEMDAHIACDQVLPSLNKVLAERDVQVRT
jgi:hypothetical protein